MKLKNKDQTLAEDIRFYFIKNDYKEGMKLPSERELCEKYKVQRATIRSALKILEREGIIELRERSGRYYSHPRIPTNLEQVKSFSETSTQMGIVLENKLIAFELIEVDQAFSRKAKVPVGSMMIKLTRIRSIVRENEVLPIIIEYSYIPEQISPKILKYDVEERSLFDILDKEYGKKPSREEQKIEIVYANEMESKYLKLDQMTALVLKEGITYSQDDEVLQYIHVVMNKDWVAFEKTDPRIDQTIKEGFYEL